MKIHRAVSEKRTYRTISDEFVSREFVAGQEIDIPDDAAPALKQYLELKLLYELRVQVLSAFVLEQMISQEDFGRQLSPYEGMLMAAKEAAFPTKEVA
jgi:hypothetical protein